MDQKKRVRNVFQSPTHMATIERETQIHDPHTRLCAQHNVPYRFIGSNL